MHVYMYRIIKVTKKDLHCGFDQLFLDIVFIRFCAYEIDRRRALASDFSSVFYACIIIPKINHKSY